MSIPLGPVSAGESFMIVSFQNNKQFVLNGRVSGNNLQYYWESNILGITSGALAANFPIFVANGTSQNDVTITDVSPVNAGGGIGFATESNTVTNVRAPPGIQFTQKQFAVGFPPNLFLTNVVYTLAKEDNTVGQIMNADGTTQPATNLLILPTVWYGNCTASGRYNQIKDPLLSLLNWYCVVNPGSGSCGEYLRIGWTTLPDCLAGQLYSYCPVDDICGTNNCNGPCSEIYYDCTFSRPKYQCVFNPTKYVYSGVWWQSPYFIVAAIGILLVIIFFVIIAFYFGSRLA